MWGLGIISEWKTILDSAKNTWLPVKPKIFKLMQMLEGGANDM
jgi:hypothetical protein